MPHIKTMFAATFAFLLLGCASTSNNPQINLTPERTSIFMVRSVVKGAPFTRTDKFPIEGYAIVYITSNFDLSDKIDERKKETRALRAKWYDSKGHVVASPINEHVEIEKSPARFWFWLLTTDMGVGPAKVEIYDGDKLLGQASFDVVDMRLGDFNKKYPYLTPDEKK